MNARSSNPRTDSGHRSTFRKRIAAGSRRTEAWIRFFPIEVRPSRRTRSFTRDTAGRLLQRVQVGPRLAQSHPPPSGEHHQIECKSSDPGRKKPHNTTRKSQSKRPEPPADDPGG